MKIVRRIAVLVACGVLIIAGLQYCSWRDYFRPFPMEAFETFQQELKTEYDYVNHVRLYQLKSGTLYLHISTDRALEWSELKDLFVNDIAPFMRGNDMMNKIQEAYGVDPLKARYPHMTVSIFFIKDGGNDPYSFRFGSSYYNTSGAISERNIIGYNRWGVESTVTDEELGPIVFDAAGNVAEE